MTAASPDAPERDFVISRWLDAPRALVFKAWTDPRHMAHWWGPAGFTIPVCELDARPGGAIRMVMRGDDGVDFPLNGTFVEIAEPERLVYRADWSEHPEVFFTHLHEALGRATTKADNLNTTTVTFEERGGRTLLTVSARFESAEIRRAAEKIGMSRGWSSSLDRLEERLTALSDTADREIVLSRVYDAPRELVFDAWTDPVQVGQWWGPDGFTTTTHEIDVRPGGTWRFIMHGPDGVNYDNVIKYIEVVRPERLVYTHGEPTFHVTVYFDDDGGRTRLRMTSRFVSAAARNQVIEESGAIEGGRQHLARLAEYLTTMEIP